MKAYIIVGETGEYDDHTRWNVVAFLNREMANRYVENRLNQFLRDNDIPLDISHSCYRGTDYGQEDQIPDNSYDIGLGENWMGFGVEYSIEEIAVIENN